MQSQCPPHHDGTFGISLVLVAYMTSVLNFSTLQLILYALLAFSSMFLAMQAIQLTKALPWIALFSIGIGLGCWQTMAVRASFPSTFFILSSLSVLACGLA
ncbi:MAG: hypothetical protein R3A45_09695 [Bdellovibrionota bacterium]